MNWLITTYHAKRACCAASGWCSAQASSAVARAHSCVVVAVARITAVYLAVGADIVPAGTAAHVRTVSADRAVVARLGRHP
jgi:hypothetical protein